MRRRANLAEIEERVHLYDQFFKEWGYSCPLPGHLKRTIDMGFPIVNLYIDTHIMAEMCHGILMAIQDLERFDGPWRLDLAQEGETFEGVSGRMLICKEKRLCSVMRRRSSAPFSRDLILERRLMNRAKILWCMSSPLLEFKGSTFQMEFI